MEITIKDFMQKQPNYPEVAETDKYYIILANRLATVWDNAHILMNVADEVRRDVVLAVTGYFQDVISDAGIWRSFSTLSQKLYGTPVPMYERPEDYIDSELNRIDINFIVWYVLETEQEQNGILSPFDKDVEHLAKLFFTTLDSVYESAPTPVEYNMIMDVDLNDEADIQHIYDLSYWLFWNSYFMRPAATATLQRNMAKAQEIIKANPDPDEARPLLASLNRQIMVENVTGPLSLSIGEWIELIVNGKLPQTDDEEKATENPHKYYKALINATGGEPIAFFDSYEALDTFLSDEMGWGENIEGHLPQMRDFKNFVILGNPLKGILIAHDVAQYISHPDNRLYDKTVASREAHKIVTEQGGVPIDLIKYLFRNNLLPDARLPFDTTGHLLHDNWDFFARLYLQTFYRAD